MSAMDDSEAILDEDGGAGGVDDFAGERFAIGLFAGVEAEVFEEEDATFFEVFNGVFDVRARDVIDKIDLDAGKKLGELHGDGF